jgi:predicted NUDIX family phosphoesterase
LSIFPFIDYAEDQIAPNEEIPPAREWAWDYENGDFSLKNGKPYVVEDLEAVKIWVYKALLTERFTHTVYSWNYGAELNRLIGAGFTQAAMELEVKRLIEEALIGNRYIESIENVSVVSDGDSLSVDFILNTIYGQAGVSV